MRSYTLGGVLVTSYKYKGRWDERARYPVGQGAGRRRVGIEGRIVEGWRCIPFLLSNAQPLQYNGTNLPDVCDVGIPIEWCTVLVLVALIAETAYTAAYFTYHVPCVHVCVLCTYSVLGTVYDPVHNIQGYMYGV